MPGATPDQAKAQARAAMMRRAVIYLMGVTIGFLLLGMLASRRAREAAARAERSQVESEAPGPAGVESGHTP